MISGHIDKSSLQKIFCFPCSECGKTVKLTLALGENPQDELCEKCRERKEFEEWAKFKCMVIKNY